MTYEPLIDDLEHIRAVDRQRFVVLRPGTVVKEMHNHVQTVLRRHFALLPVSYPTQAHVTLAGFGVGTPLHAVQSLVESWSRGVAPLRIGVERLTFFPAPFQIVIVRVLKTRELFAALSGLRQRAGEDQLAIDTTISPQNWTYHISVAYCSRLSGQAWSDLTQFCQGLEVPSPYCVVNEVEVVAFDEGREYSGGVYSLRLDPAGPIA
jgi:2'-5' RNA ligase